MKRIINKLIAVGILVASPTLGLSAPPATPQTTPTQSATGQIGTPPASHGTSRAEHKANISALTQKHHADLTAIKAKREAILQSMMKNVPADHTERRKLLQQMRKQMETSFQEEYALGEKLRSDLGQAAQHHHQQFPGGATP